MADGDTTKLIISLELILRNLEKTLSGLSQVEKQLKSVASVKLGGTTAGGFDKAALAAGKLAAQAQEVANRQAKAALTADKLALSQLKLEQAFARAAAAATKTAQAQAKSDSASAQQAQRAAAEVARINAATAKQAQQQEALRARAAKTIADVQVREAQRGADSLVNSLQRQTQASEQFNKTIQGVGNSLRSIGQGLSTLGIGLTLSLIHI